MSRYEISFLASARKQLRAIEPSMSQRLGARIDALADDPRPPSATKLVGSEYWRVRVGDYRVVYDIHDDELIVLVVRIAHRREVYR